MDDDNSRPIISLVEGIHVLLDERRKSVVAADDVSLRLHERLQLDRMERHLGQSKSVEEDGQRVDGRNRFQGFADSAEVFGEVGPADVEESLPCQAHGQPDRRGVEYGRYVLDQAEVGETPAVGNPIFVQARRVETKKDGGRPQPCQGVRNCHGHQKNVSRTSEGLLAEYSTDQAVCDECDDNEERGQVSIHH